MRSNPLQVGLLLKSPTHHLHLAVFGGGASLSPPISSKQSGAAAPSIFPSFVSQPFACTSICHGFISWQLPFHSHPPIHQASLLQLPLKLHHTSLILRSVVLLLPLPSARTPSLIHRDSCATPRAVAQKKKKKGQLTDLKTPESPVSQGLDLICINLHNLVKGSGRCCTHCSTETLQSETAH